MLPSPHVSISILSKPWAIAPSPCPLLLTPLTSLPRLASPIEAPRPTYKHMEVVKLVVHMYDLLMWNPVKQERCHTYYVVRTLMRMCGRRKPHTNFNSVEP